MSLRAWLQMFVTAGAVAWNVGLTSSAHAQPPAGTAGTADNVPALPEVDVPAPEQSAPPVNLQPNFDPFSQNTVITNNPYAAGVTSGYSGVNSTAGSIIAMPKLGFPGSVDTVTRDTIRDQQAINFNDVIRNVAGANAGFGGAQLGDGVRRPDQFILRGLEVSAQNFRKDGFMDPTSTPRDLANVERIDVVKGPMGMAYGAASPSGTVNVVTKRAVQDNFAVGSVQMGSWDMMRYTVDANSMSRNGNFLFRINAAYQDMNSFRQFGFNERTFVAPTATWLISDRTAITFAAEFNNDRRLYDTGVVAINNNPNALPRDKFLGDPNDFFKFHDYRATLNLTHNINDNWSLYVGGTTLFNDFQSQGTQPFRELNPVNPEFFSFSFVDGSYNGGLLGRRRFLGGQQGKNSAAIAYLNGKWNGPLFRHNTTIGTEHDWFLRTGLFPTSVAGVPSIVPAAYTPTATPNAGIFFLDFDLGGYQQRNSVFFQDLVEVTDRLRVMYGVRWDYLHQSTDFAYVGFGVNNVSRNTYNQGTPRAGITYDLVPELMTMYGMYTTGFNGAIEAFGVPGPGGNYNPSTSQQWEAGVKTQLTDNLLATFGTFIIERQNVAIQNDLQAGVPTFVNGNQRSKGIEMTLVGNWTDRLSTITNYAYTDAKQTDPGANGIEDVSGRLRDVPFNTANAWTRYNFIQNRDRVIGAGLGTTYVGDRRGDYGGFSGSPLVLPSYTRWDAGLFASVGRWDANMYVENLFNEYYQTSSISQLQVFNGNPTTFRFYLGARF